jgi:hypothetical protein
VILLVASNSSVFLNYYLWRKKSYTCLEKKKKKLRKKGRKKQSLNPGDESYTLIWAEDHRVKITNLNANQQEDHSFIH